MEASGAIDEGLGFHGSKTGHVVGAWSDGAENSVMETTWGVSPKQLKVSAAMKAHLADQKQALVFHDRENGPDWLYSFVAKGELRRYPQGCACR
jgi:hypothetical protein